MKNIYYTLSNFHKAVKRNKPQKVYFDDISDEFWFFTQKAIINFSANNSKESDLLRNWLSLNGVDSIEWSSAR